MSVQHSSGQSGISETGARLGVAESARERAPGVANREWAFLLLVFLTGVVLVLTRKPDVITNPQFYIEDGARFYREAHDQGLLGSIFVTHRGYIVLAARLAALVAVMFPFKWGPLLLALAGVGLNVLPAVFLASNRFAHVVPSRAIRLLLALLLIGLPNAWTVMASATNGMWYLAVLAFFVLVARTPDRIGWRSFDLAVMVVSGLSGPFSLLLSPVAWLNWWRRRERWSFVLAVTTSVTALIQIGFLLFSVREQGEPMALGASPLRFCKLLIKRVVYEGLFGQIGGTGIYTHAWGDFWTNRWMLAAVGIAGLVMLVYTVRRGPFELLLFILFAGLTLCASLARPGATPVGAVFWDLLVGPGNGNRYFVLPVLAFLFTCVWLIWSPSRLARAAGMVLVAIVAVLGVGLNWRAPAYPNFDFPASVRRFDAAPAGSQILMLTPPDLVMAITKSENEPVIIAADECTGGAPVAPELLAANQMRMTGLAGLAEGSDPYVILGVPRQHVCGVRVRFVLVAPGRSSAFLQAWWAESAEEELSDSERASFAFVHSSRVEQTVTFAVHDTIDRIRLDPGDTPVTQFEVLEVVLLKEAQ